MWRISAKFFLATKQVRKTLHRVLYDMQDDLPGFAQKPLGNICLARYDPLTPFYFCLRGIVRQGFRRGDRSDAL
jgi:hypothetical protein